MDKGHRYTDKQIEALEKRLNRFYKGISDELMNELTEYLKAHTDEINALWERLDNGELVDVESFVYREMDSEINRLSEQCVKADADAMEQIGAVMMAVYVFNHNAEAKTLNDKTGAFISFIRNITKKQPTKDTQERPKPPKTDRTKDYLWHNTKIHQVVIDGIRNGRSIDYISRRLEVVTKMDVHASIRAARTACTNAENQGKLEAMYTLRDEFGIDVKKMWYATLDNRTRTAHREIHGEIRELEDEFSNGLQFPADPDGDPSEVWNCRCTLLEVISEMDIPQAPKGMSREAWEQQTPKYKHYPRPNKKK